MSTERYAQCESGAGRGQVPDGHRAWAGEAERGGGAGWLVVTVASLFTMHASEIC